MIFNIDNTRVVVAMVNFSALQLLHTSNTSFLLIYTERRAVEQISQRNRAIISLLHECSLNGKGNLLRDLPVGSVFCFISNFE